MCSYRFISFFTKIQSNMAAAQIEVADDIKLFNKWSFEEVDVKDIALTVSVYCNFLIDIQ